MNLELSDERDLLVASQTDLEPANERLAHEATHDPLTGLANRALLADRLGAAVSGLVPGRGDRVALRRPRPLQGGQRPAGHACGDEVLRIVAQRMSAAVRFGDTVQRVGGDEFVVVLPNIASVEGVERLADRLLADLARPYLLADGPTSIGATIGIAWTDRHEDAERLLAQADATMYSGKQTGRCRIVLAASA